MSFVLVKLVKDGDGIRQEETDYGPFPTGREASQEAKRLTDLIGATFKPKPVTSKVDWRQREATAYEMDNLRHLPPAWNLEPIPDHFLLRVNEGMLSYFASASDGERGRRTVQKPGRYLTQFYPHLTEAQCGVYVAIADPGSVFHIARTRREVRRVYRHGPDSCMKNNKAKAKGDDEKYVTSIDIYSDCDLGVAYLMDERNNITARAVCWPARKQYGRLYGDSPRLSILLEDAGYQQVSHFDGAVVNPQKIIKRQKEYYLFPCFDNIIRVSVDQSDPMVFKTSLDNTDDVLIPVSEMTHKILAERRVLCAYYRYHYPVNEMVKAPDGRWVKKEKLQEYAKNKRLLLPSST